MKINEETMESIEIKEDELKKAQMQPLKQRCIYKSWHWIERFFNNPKITAKDKAYLAVKIVCKDMDVPLVDQSQHNHYVIFRDPEAVKDERKISELQTG